MNNDLERRNAVLNAWSCREFDMRYWKKTTLEASSRLHYLPLDFKQAQIADSLNEQTILECTDGIIYMDATLIYSIKTNKFYIIKDYKIWEISNIYSSDKTLFFSTVLNTILNESYSRVKYCIFCGDLCKGGYVSDSGVCTISCSCGTYNIRISELEKGQTIRREFDHQCIYCGIDLFKTDDEKHCCTNCELIFEILNENNTESETKEEC